MAGCSGRGRQEQGNQTLVHILYSSKRLCGKVVGWEGGGVGGMCALVTVKHLSPWVFQLQLTNHITVICLGEKKEKLIQM